MVDALAAVSGVAPRVLWSNAGNIFEFVVRRTQGLPQEGGAGHAAAARVLTSRRRSGAPNPLFEPIRYVPEAGDAPGGSPPRRVRKVCCLRYFIPDQSLCGACPLPARPEAGPAGTSGPRRSA
ncbi:siderophore-iron reductase FhuF [Methylobacterium sp. NMS12]